MDTWLLGGAIGALITGLGMGLVLWYERDKRAKAEEKAWVFELGYNSKAEKVRQLTTLVERKDERIAKLEKLVPTDALFDELFDGTKSANNP